MTELNILELLCGVLDAYGEERKFVLWCVWLLMERVRMRDMYPWLEGRSQKYDEMEGKLRVEKDRADDLDG